MLKKKYLNPHTSFTRKPSAFLAALLFTYLLFSASAAEIELSEREAAWLREHPSVTIALDENNAPLNFKGTGGTYAGISVDFMELIGQKAGLDILYWGGTWDEALQRAFDHEVDGIMSASYKEERLQYLNFTDPYCEMPMAVATRKGHQGGEYLSSFNGERFAVVRASVRVPIIQQHCPDSEILLVETSLEGMRALAEGRTDVYFDDLPVVQHLIEQQLMSNLKVALLYYYPRAGAQRVGLRNDQPELLSVFDKAIDAITVEERREIISKWLGLGRDAPEHRDIPLTGEEMEWLREHRTVRVAIDPSWPPIEWKDASGNYQGITMDYLAALEKILNVQFEIINGDSWEAMLLAPEKLNVDLFPSLSPTPPRREYMGFTKPYLSFPIVVFANSDTGYLSSMKELKGKKVTLIKGHTAQEYLEQDWPDITILPSDNIPDAVEALRKGEVDYFIGGLATISHYLQSTGDTSLRVVGETPYAYELSMATSVDRPLLLSSIQKALDSMPASRHEAIRARWFNIQYEHGFQYDLLWKIGLPALLIVLLVLLWNSQLRQQVTQRKKAEAELIAYRGQLEQLVEERTRELELSMMESKRLAFAIEQAAEIFFITDIEGHFEYVNPAFEEITGYSREEVMGKTPSILKSGKQGAEVYKQLWNTVLAGRSWRGHLVNRRKDGTLFEEDAVIFPIKSEDGTIINFMAVKRDVTESEKMKRRLEQSQKMEAIGTLAGGVAHDFNNILGAIMGYTEIARMELEEEHPVQEFLREIHTSAVRAQDLVQQILSFSRQTEIEKRPVKLIPLIKETVRFLRATLPTTINIQYSIDLDQDVVMADPTQIHQVLVNLCTNAGHAMRETGGRLTVNLERLDHTSEDTSKDLPPGPYARLSVQDTGEGMSEDVRERIFEPYFTTKKKGEGTGLGLAVVHGIVKEAGGEINCYSEKGKGSVFVVLLPLKLGKDKHKSPAPSSSQMPHGTETILLVDDEKSLVKIGSRWLEKLGYNVLATTVSENALELFEKSDRKVALVICDKTMPGMTGFDIAKAVRQIDEKVPFLICSGFLVDEDYQTIDRYENMEALLKPLEIQNLAVKIRDMLEAAKVE